MKAVKLVGILVAGVMSTSMAFGQALDHGRLNKLKEHRAERRAEREQWRQKLEGELKQQDAELDKVQADLNSATGEKKVDALAAAVNKLIDQRKKMHSEMESKIKSIQQRREQMKENLKEAIPGGGAMPSPGGSPELAPTP